MGAGRGAARQHAEGLPGAEVRLHAGLERRQLLRVHLRPAAAALVRAQLQALHAIIITSIVIRVSSRVLVVVLLLSLPQSSAVELNVVAMCIGWRYFDVLVLILRRFISVFGEWTRFVQLQQYKKKNKSN